MMVWDGQTSGTLTDFGRIALTVLLLAMRMCHDAIGVASDWDGT